MHRYVFDRPPAIKNASKADPQKIGEALTALADEADGHLRPQAVVEAAKDEASPLHQHFEWDVQKAAEAHWLDQAREIIRLVRVIDDDDEEDAAPRAFLSISDTEGTSYRAYSEIMDSSDLQHAVLKQAKRDLEAFRRRYRGLQAVCDLVKVAEDAVDEVARSSRAKRRERVQETAET